MCASDDIHYLLQKGTGHTLLRLPPYHYDWAPIEMGWGNAKTYYSSHIRQKIQDNPQPPTGKTKQIVVGLNDQTLPKYDHGDKVKKIPA